MHVSCVNEPRMLGILLEGTDGQWGKIRLNEGDSDSEQVHMGYSDNE